MLRRRYRGHEGRGDDEGRGVGAAEVQKRASLVLLDRDDLILQSETGSGKTLAFLMPLLSLLDYPPALYPDDLKVRNLADGTPSSLVSPYTLESLHLGESIHLAVLYPDQRAVQCTVSEQYGQPAIPTPSLLRPFDCWYH